MPTLLVLCKGCGSAAVLDGGVDVDAGIDQHLDHVKAAVGSCPVQGWAVNAAAAATRWSKTNNRRRSVSDTA